MKICAVCERSITNGLWCVYHPFAEAVAKPDSVPGNIKMRRITIDICQPCLDGQGSECHTPGCALYLHQVDLPITPGARFELARALPPRGF